MRSRPTLPHYTQLMPIFHRPLTRFAALVLAFTLASTPCWAEELIVQLGIDFTASSTLHGFGGHAAALSAPLTAQPGATDLWSADIDVPVASLDTGNGKRDKKMLTMLDAEHFPLIHGELRNLDPIQIRERETLPFLLVIRDIERETVAHVSNWQASDDEVTFDASFDISLEEFGLEAPGVLFIRVADRVSVSVHAQIREN